MKEQHSRWLVLGVASLAVFMFFLDATIVNISFPALRAAFPSASQGSLSWVLNAYTITFAALLVAAGRTADLVGRRRTFLTGLAIFAAASALCALAPSVALLIAGRAAQAVGGAMVVPSALGLVLPEFRPEERGTAVGIWSAVAAVAAAVGPTLGSGIVDLGGWRWIFLVNLPVGIAAILMGRAVLRESSDPAATRPDLLGALGLGAAMALLALGVVEGGEWGWSSARTASVFLIALAGLVAVLVRSARHPSPIVDVRLFRIRSFGTANTASLLFGIGFFASMLNGVLFLTGVWGYSMLKAGLAITPGPIAAGVLAAIGGRIADRRGYRAVVVPGCALAAASAVWLLAFAEPEPQYLLVWLPASLLMGAGIGLGFATLGGAAVSSLPPSWFALGSGVLSTSRQFGGAIGVAALIAVHASDQLNGPMVAFDRSFVLIGASVLAAGLVSLRLSQGSAEPRTASLEADLVEPLHPEGIHWSPVSSDGHDATNTLGESIHRFLAAYKAGWADPASGALAGIWAEDAVMMHPELAEPMQGRAAIMAYLTDILRIVPDLSVTPLASAANGSTVFVHFKARATVAGEPIEWEGVDRFELGDGVAVAGRGFFDTALIRQALTR